MNTAPRTYKIKFAIPQEGLYWNFETNDFAVVLKTIKGLLPHSIGFQNLSSEEKLQATRGFMSMIKSAPMLVSQARRFTV